MLGRRIGAKVEELGQRAGRWGGRPFSLHCRRSQSWARQGILDVHCSLHGLDRGAGAPMRVRGTGLERTASLVGWGVRNAESVVEWGGGRRQAWALAHSPAARWDGFSVLSGSVARRATVQACGLGSCV
uniref:Uncharacterized protein n=1 Tax=Arundo donax TaxID=35708 RepID=A0A0A9EXI4_ARUDO